MQGQGEAREGESSPKAGTARPEVLNTSLKPWGITDCR